MVAVIWFWYQQMLIELCEKVEATHTLSWFFSVDVVITFIVRNTFHEGKLNNNNKKKATDTPEQNDLPEFNQHPN